ncbi:MAG: hypothetical protein GY778_19465 [bacterium]|nr:hypothetical protein [bacterium]
MATDLTLTITGDTETTPGGTISYQITGLLSDSVNEGLALFGFDMEVSGPAAVDLSTATTVLAGPAMGPFVADDGLNNPAGFGGTPSGDNLLQVGGGQNTIGNPGPTPPAPTGTVDDSGLGHTSVILASGDLTMPTTSGVYTVSVTSGFGNVIRQGEVGPVYAVDAIGAVTGGSFDVTVGPGVISAVSRRTHPGAGDFDIPLDGPGLSGTESRSPATTLVLTFDQDLDPATTGTGNVDMQDENGTPFAVTGTSLAGNVLTIDLGAGPPDEHCYSIDLTGMQTLAANEDLVFNALTLNVLRGDVNASGIVNATDKNLVKGNINKPVNIDKFIYDVNASGLINATDKNLTKGWIGGTLVCP